MTIMNNKQILKKFSDFIGIESVSTDGKRHKEILKATDFIKKELEDLGCQVNLYYKGDCPPLIIGKKSSTTLSRKDGIKIGVYAHYDVQPEDPVKEWGSPPFKLTIKDKKIYGRGVADDKGHLIEILAAAKNLIKAKKLKNNLIFIFEGEEELGSLNFEELIKKDQSLKDIDVFYVVDMGMKTKDIPQIFYGLRGIIDFELKIITSKSDLHSGVFGNKVLNPAQLIAELMSKMVDGQSHKIKIPGFYDDVKKIDKEEEKVLLQSNSSLQSKILPSLDINGIFSGYLGEGIKTIIPSEATVKFSFRLVPKQSHKKIKKLIEKFIKDNLPKNLEYKLKTFSGSDSFYTDFKNRFAQKTAEIFKEVFGNETLFNRSGGSVPAAEILQRIFKKPVILIGFTLPDNNIHAPNENFDEEMFFKGIVAIEKIFAQ